MTYFRVIPRDFFNESKLLKCLGQFELWAIERRSILSLAAHAIAEAKGTP